MTTGIGITLFAALLLGNGLGIFTCEWKGADGISKKWLVLGLATLIGGIVIVSFGNAMISADDAPVVSVSSQW